jgi:hypothetical protein
MTQEEIKSTLIDVAGKLGVPFVVLALFLWMAREAATSIHKTVVIPIVESHTEFLDSTRQTLDRISTTQEKQAETLQEIAVGQTEIRHAVMKSGS